MGLIKRNKIWIMGGLFLVIVPIVIKSTTFLFLLTQVGIAVVFALSYNLLLGQCGLLSFGHTVFFGLGAYFTIHALRLVNSGLLPISTPFLPIVGGLAGMALGGIIGAFSTRKAGATYAMITMGVNEVVVSFAFMFSGFFGSETGIEAIREPWLGIKFGPQVEVYYLIIPWVFICIILMYGLTKTPLGKIANAVRDNPERVGFMGYNPVLVRVLVMVSAGFFAGLGGGLYALNWEIVSYDNLSIMQSAFVLFMVFIGGVGYFFGPIIGAVLVTFLIFHLSAFTEAWLLYLGLLFMIMVLFAPSGIAGIIMIHRPIRERGLLKVLVPGYLISLIPLLLIGLSFVTIVELVYHRWSAARFSGSDLSVFGIEIGSSVHWPLILGILGVVFGIYLFRKTLPRVRKQWIVVNKKLKELSSK